MRILAKMLLGTAILAAPALAQTAPAKNNSAIKTAHTVDDGSSRRGANSFTQKQAREHIAKSGFTDVSVLAKDQHGVWRGTAKKDGHTFQVGLDFKGNVSTGK
ncbi:hypothetical protein [Sphingomonas nostoxanthinifaciens]|uniref:hypothetical protein n=1 Tax=Sphingomonas nostoxanthinifaciens TaxID=2872652 RepID=UPI001CC1E80B|nr:hypothetical protein [Sphingomonas nostoxanthinifaciens]UAK25685.1 hypothetical protein K8P63_05970 [Sphingomonas nostoxanthinifaciens]